MDKEEEYWMEVLKNAKPLNEKLEVKFSKTTVLSVRLPRELLKELEIEARSNDMGPATYARLAIEEKLACSPEASTKLLLRVVGNLSDKLNSAIEKITPAHKTATSK